MSDALKAREALRAALHQLDINVSIARRDHPEGPIIDGKRLNVDALPHSQEILAGHVKDRINEALAALSALDQPSGVRMSVKPNGDEINRMADAIDAARYAHPQHPRERDRPFAEADKGDREYAFRLARAAFAALDLSAIGAEGWRTMDSAPKDGTRFLALEGTRHFDCWWHFFEADEVFYWQDEADSEPEPRYWRPLPSPPEPRP